MALGEIQTALNGGELSPKLYARTDLAKFEAGAALLRNFMVDFRGGVNNRPGTKFIAACKNVAGAKRLIPFTVSTDAAYVLEFGELYVRVYLLGALVTEVVTPYHSVDLALLKYTQSADVLTLVHPSYAPANLSRTSGTTFSYDLIITGPVEQPPTITTMVAPHSGPYSFGYLVTAINQDGKEESLPSNPGVKHSEGMNETTNRVIGLTWTAPSTPASAYNIYKWGPIDSVTLNPATVWGFIGTSQTTTFTDNNIAPDFSKQPPQGGDPFSGGQFQSITVNNGGSGYDGVAGDWPTAVPYVPLTITGDGTGAAGYAVISHSTGKIIGVYLTNAGKNYTAATVTANGQGGTGATFNFTFSDIQPIYPGCTAYIQQRRAFAGSNLKPETLALSQVGLYNNFDRTPISLATDAIAASIAGEQVNTIKSMVPVSYGLLLFTTSQVELMNGGSPYAPIAPDTISFQVQSATGANDLIPLRVNADVLYAQNKGNRVRNLTFAWQKQAYQGSDVSALAAHLFDGFQVTDWCWAEEPFKIVWCVRDDGHLLSLTYVPDQEVTAWCRHDTQGLFQSVCSIPEGNTNAVYVIVERHIENDDGVPCWVQYIERLMERDGCCLYDSWFLDSALSIHTCVGTSNIYLTQASPSSVNVYSYDPCSTPSGAFGVPCADAYTLLWTGGAINYVQPTGATPEEVGLDANLNQYTLNGSNGINCTDVNMLGLWQMGYVEFDTMFTNAGATLVPSILNDFNVFITADGLKCIFTLTDVEGGAYFLYIGVAPIPATGVVALPVLTNYVKMRLGIAAYRTIGWFDMWSSGTVQSCVLETRDFSTTNIQFWLMPTVAQIEAGTFKGHHPGCTGTLVADQAPGYSIQWTHSSAHAMGYSKETSSGTVANNYVGFLASVGSSQRFYLVMPRAWMNGGSSSNSGMYNNWHTTYPNGGAFYLDLTSYGFYANAVWGGGSITIVTAITTDAIDITSTGFLNSDGTPAIPWPDEWTRILDGGANAGWLASYQGRAFLKYDNGVPTAFFNIVDGNPNYATLIGGGQRVFYARVRAYGWNGTAFVETSEASGIVLRQGDLTHSDWAFDAVGTETMFVYNNNIYFQMINCRVTNQGSLLTKFGEFSPVRVGDCIRIGCGEIVITQIVDQHHWVGTIEVPLTEELLSDDPVGTYVPVLAGEWSTVRPTNTITLAHLKGKEVWALGDGQVYGPLTANEDTGVVTLPSAVCNLVAGLSYVQQIETLDLTMDDLQPGSIQGKRKLIPSVVLRLDCTKGISAGQDFNTLTAVPDCNDIDANFVGLNPDALFSGDAYVVLGAAWNEKGRVCIQQDLPLPTNVLGIIVQVVPGDTGR